VPSWGDVLLTAMLMWLAAAGVVLIIAMVKVNTYQVREGSYQNSIKVMATC
jgi:hypothetical protein